MLPFPPVPPFREHTHIVGARTDNEVGGVGWGDTAKATDENLTSENWEFMMDVWEKVNNAGENGWDFFFFFI